MNRKITAILVDDHAVVRAGFRMLLASGDKIEVIGEAARGEQAIQLYQDCRPDVVVMDLSMPGMGGLETIRRIIQRDSAALILVFSVHHEQVYVGRALNAGAKGYITKNSATEMLSEAIDAIMRGEVYVECGLLKNPHANSDANDHQAVLAEFSPREFDVFRLLAEGLTAQKVADQLCLGHKTVANYATQIKKKLQVDTTTELAHIAVNLGMLRR
ncbi:response regulator transcription factor [Methylomonas sp. SURF-2]|uniref:Response regulator transcription factor n=1 Tax=Methylomonas subterranea TaxID=2952225 RepID=A0ABT1TDC5_9GAMM|nr:response regulator transcription factor [Methylomonas sp. SURF-2]MCQ8103448.1 response regulator transcription factor [Methylomonas sp. SURF-2]